MSIVIETASPLLRNISFLNPHHPSADNPGTTQSGDLGGAVSNVALTIDPADRVPTATAKKITFSFSIQTSLSAGMPMNMKLCVELDEWLQATRSPSFTPLISSEHLLSPSTARLLPARSKQMWTSPRTLAHLH